MANNCTEDVYCPICKDKGHAAGDKRCKAFREAMKKATEKLEAPHKARNGQKNWQDRAGANRRSLL